MCCLSSVIGGNVRSDVTSITRSAWSIKTRSDAPAISQQGGKSWGVLASTVFERNLSFRPSLISTRLPSGHRTTIFYLSTTEKSRRKALFLYCFDKKKHKKRQPKWSPKCVRTTTATARPPSTGWSTWSCLPLTPTLQWWEQYHVKVTVS